MQNSKIVALFVAFLTLGCGGETVDAPAGQTKNGEPPTFGKSDAAFAIVEAGRFTVASGTLTGTVDGVNAQAFRFNGFGNTKVQIALSSPGLEMDAYVLIDGPFPGGEGQVVAFNDDDPRKDALDSWLEVTLEKPGAYRILVGSYGTFNKEPGAGGAFELTYGCLEGCEMPQITLAQLLGGISNQVGQEGTLQAVQDAMTAIFPDAPAAQVAGVLAQAEAAMADPNNAEIFPVLPLVIGGPAQGLFEAKETPIDAPGPVHFDVAEILTQGCGAKRSTMEPVHPSIPGLMRGSYADFTIDECSLQRWQAFAEVLNNLALENGSTVTHAGETFTSVEAVVDALLAAGHHITITNDRFFADFLGLYYNGAAVAAPMWLETTIPLKDGSANLAIPSPHTHHTIRVRGPLVNADIMYYMGVSGGTSFRAVSNLRSPWTGLRTLYTYDSATDAAAVKDLLVTAGKLRKKWTDEAGGLPAAGYGTLGVCNDSTGVLEMSQEGTATIFPFAHPAVTAQDAADELDSLLAQIPSDLNGYDATDALNRILKTLPQANLADLAFPQFAQQITALAQ